MNFSLSDKEQGSSVELLNNTKKDILLKLAKDTEDIGKQVKVEFDLQRLEHMKDQSNKKFL